MTDQEYTVTAAVPGRDVKLTHGDFKSYTVTLDPGGVQAGLLQKPETPAPTEGDRLYGHLEERNGFKNFKKAARPGAPGGGGGWRPRDPDESRMIVRQHSQEMALRYCDVRARQGKLPAEFTLTDLAKVVDWFQKDATEGGKT